MAYSICQRYLKLTSTAQYGCDKRTGGRWHRLRTSWSRCSGAALVHFSSQLCYSLRRKIYSFRVNDNEHENDENDENDDNDDNDDNGNDDDNDDDDDNEDEMTLTLISNS